jgi:hypothetical protein
MKIKIRRNGKYVYVIETALCQPPELCPPPGIPLIRHPDSLLGYVRDITDHHSCVVSDGATRPNPSFDGAENFILVQLNDEMLHQCASLMGGAVDHFVNQLVEYLKDLGFEPVPDEANKDLEDATAIVRAVIALAPGDGQARP